MGSARLAGFRLALDKRASDGSGKANLVREAGASVWGVVFTLEPADLGALDGFEPGYERLALPVTLREGSELAAQLYLSEERSTGLRAQPWYKALILEGAREHTLPDDWIALLERLPVLTP